MKRLVLVLLVSWFASTAHGQAVLPTATSSVGIDSWEEVQVGVTMMGSPARTSGLGGATALYVGRHIQAAYLGPTFQLSGEPARFSLMTSVGVSRTASPSSSPQSDAGPSHVYPLSSMVGLVIQDEARALLLGIEYSSGYHPVSVRHRPYLRRYEYAQQRRFVLGLGWSL